MKNAMRINEEVSVGPQPSEQGIQQLGDQNFKTVVNFRSAGEDEQPLSPDTEGEKVRAAGMEYLNVPVTLKSMKPEVVDRFRHRFADLPKPVFAHCKSGKRAGAMVMMHVACESGMTGEQTIQKAEELGFECDKPELVEFVKKYVDDHSRQA